MKPYYEDDSVTLFHGAALDVLHGLDGGSVDCVVTSPPYFGLRDYGVDGQQGLEATPAEYISGMVAVFREVHRVLADDGTLWLNVGDSYAGRANGGDSVGPGSGSSKPIVIPKRRNTTAAAPYKSMLGIPWRLALALVDDGWTLRNDVIWNKPNAMPESVTDRLASRHEHVFLLTKSARYWFDLAPIRAPHSSTADRAGKEALRGQKAIRPVGPNSGSYSEGGRNPGDVWTIATRPFPHAHFATMPLELASRAVQAGCKTAGVVLDPFSGSGTSGLAAAQHGRRYVGIDLNADYLDLSLRTRLAQTALFDGEASA